MTEKKIQKNAKMLKTPANKKSTVVFQVPIRTKTAVPKKEYKSARRLDFNNFVLHADDSSDTPAPQ